LLRVIKCQRQSYPAKALIEKSDCKSCHTIDQKSAVPAYKDVAAKYKGQTGAIDLLAAKVVKGGSGFGEQLKWLRIRKSLWRTQRK
jgi:cytochrome c551/c552